MGLYCSLKSATSGQLDLLMRDPDLIPVFYDGEDAGFPERSFLDRVLRRRHKVPEEIRELTMQTSLDKSWHGLHYLFTRTAWEGELPEAFIVKGGRKMGGDDNRAISPEEAVGIKDYAHSLSDDILRQRFDPEEMTRLRIYPDIIWKRDDPEDTIEWLLEYYQILRSFLRDVVDERHGFVISIG